MELSKKLGEMQYDGLITDLIPPVQTRGGIIASVDEDTTYVRGTVFAKSAEGKLEILGKDGEADPAKTPDCILCDDTEVKSGADVTVAVYTAGCFDPEKVTVGAEYTMTESDKDKLRERGIVFKAASSAL